MITAASAALKAGMLPPLVFAAMHGARLRSGCPLSCLFASRDSRSQRSARRLVTTGASGQTEAGPDDPGEFEDFRPNMDAPLLNLLRGPASALTAPPLATAAPRGLCTDCGVSRMARAEALRQGLPVHQARLRRRWRRRCTAARATRRGRTSCISARSAAWCAPRSRSPATARNGPASPRASPSGCWRPARSTPC